LWAWYIESVTTLLTFGRGMAKIERYVYFLMLEGGKRKACFPNNFSTFDGRYAFIFECRFLELFIKYNLHLYHNCNTLYSTKGFKHAEDSNAEHKD